MGLKNEAFTKIYVNLPKIPENKNIHRHRASDLLSVTCYMLHSGSDFRKMGHCGLWKGFMTVNSAEAYLFPPIEQIVPTPSTSGLETGRPLGSGREFSLWDRV